MKRSQLLTIAVLGLLVINLGTLVYMFTSRPAREGRPMRGEGPKRIIIERLGFDARQQEEYEVLVHDHRKKSRELNQRSRELHESLFSLLKRTDYENTSDSLIRQISLNQEAIDILNVTHFEKIKALCRNGQVEKFNALAGDLAHLFAPEGPPPH